MNSSYATAKAAIIGFTKALALELGRTGVTVNAVAPGLIDNILQVGQSGSESATIPGEIGKEMADRIIKFFMRRIPMKRLGKPEDIALAHLYLASDDAAYITGQVLSPNGGYVM